MPRLPSARLLPLLGRDFCWKPEESTKLCLGRLYYHSTPRWEDADPPPAVPSVALIFSQKEMKPSSLSVEEDELNFVNQNCQEKGIKQLVKVVAIIGRRRLQNSAVLYCSPWPRPSTVLGWSVSPVTRLFLLTGIYL